MLNDPKLSHAGPKTVAREAELTAPTGVGSSAVLGWVDLSCQCDKLGG